MEARRARRGHGGGLQVDQRGVADGASLLGWMVGAADAGVAAEGATISRTSVATGVYWQATMVAQPIPKKVSATANRIERFVAAMRPAEMGRRAPPGSALEDEVGLHPDGLVVGIGRVVDHGIDENVGFGSEHHVDGP